MAKLVLEIDPRVWKCPFYLRHDNDGYEDQCMLANIGRCCGEVHLRPPECPLKEDDSEGKVESFRAGVKDYLDLVDKELKTLESCCEAAMCKSDKVMEMIMALNVKVDCIAIDQGLVSKDDLPWHPKGDKH